MLKAERTEQGGKTHAARLLLELIEGDAFADACRQLLLEWSRLGGDWLP
jgi:hypothetical protein